MSETPAEHAECYTPTEIRWRLVTGGMVLVVDDADDPEGAPPQLWAVGSSLLWRGVVTVTASHAGHHHRAEVDPDDYVTVLMSAPVRAALEAVDDALGVASVLEVDRPTLVLEVAPEDLIDPDGEPPY